MMKKIVKILIFLLIVALIVVGAVKFVKKRKAQEAKIPKAKEYAVLIHTADIKKSNVRLTLPTIALAQSDNNVMVSSKVAGRVIFAKKSGDIVKKGETIIKLDSSALVASLKSVEHSIQSAKLALSNLELVHKRTKKLLSVGGATKEQYDNEQVKIDAQKAKIASLLSKKASILDNLSYATIKASSDAIISQSMVHIGDTAMPGKPLMKLSGGKNSYLLVRIPNSAKALIFDKKLYQLKNLNSTFNGLNEFRADIDKSLPVGEREDVDLVVFNGNGFKLPFDAILNRDGKDFVLTIKNNKIVPKEVKIVASGQEGVVVEGIESVEKIAIAKPDILLRLISGYPFVIKKDK